MADGAHDAQMSSEEEHEHSEEEREDNDGPRAARVPLMMPIEFLQLLAGRRFDLPEPENNVDNTGLVSSLRRNGMLSSDTTYRALLECPRASFVPPRYKREANFDSPIRVTEHDFNISAPHMHAQMLDSMDLQPGDRVLDVGCGCGILAACAAFLVGKEGEVLGVDTKQYCVELCRKNVEQLKVDNPTYAARACEVTFKQDNIFLLAHKLRGKYNKVLVGATCPEQWVASMYDILPDTGGMLLVPVDTDLRLYNKTREGKPKSKVVSSVRFQDLEVPSQSAVLMSALTEEQQARLQVEVSPSTMKQDFPLQPSDSPGCSPIFRMCGSCFSPSSPPLDTISSSSFTSAGTTAAAPAGPCSEDMCDDGSKDVFLGSSQGPLDQEGAWGAADMVLVGKGWKLEVHKQVLRGRSQHFKAQLSAGMRDANDHSHMVHDDFSEGAMRVFLHYLYQDELPLDLEPSMVVEVARVSCYYGTPRLSELCEQRLAEELLQLDPAAGCSEAPSLLQLASNLGLQQLARVAASYCAQHYDQVRQSETYKVLSPEGVDLVALELDRELRFLKGLVTGPLDGSALPHPTEGAGGGMRLLRRVLL